MTDADLQAFVAAVLVRLAFDNVPTDVQELLVRGDPERRIRPRTLEIAIARAYREYLTKLQSRQN